MERWCAIFLLSLFISCWGHIFSGGAMNCDWAESAIGQNIYSVRSEYIDGNETVTTYSIYEIVNESDYPETDYTPKVEIERAFKECVGKNIVHVEVSVNGKVKKKKATSHIVEPLRFYGTGAKNAVVSPGEKTVKRINELDAVGFGGVLTNRALKTNELFEVRVEKLTLKYEDSLGIGVTHHTPTSINYSDWMACGTIMLYDHELYEHGIISKRGYGTNLRNLKVGDHVGVMKKRNGDLHFFINGEDQGLARSNITYSVYGVLDVYGKVVEVSIVS